jgi:phospholipid N-methyltransferase
MSFFLEYIKHPFAVGAIAPSGKGLARKMTEPIDFSAAEVIVEYGPGTGAFTGELIARRRPGAALLLIEQNEQFCAQLGAQFAGAEKVYVLHGSAADVNRHLRACGYEKADYVISGLPFTSLPKEVSEDILLATKQAIGREGKFITFQYSLVKRKLFERYFRITRTLHEVKNLPPAYVLVMQNPEEPA